jgi:signal transduction histidine kinase
MHLNIKSAPLLDVGQAIGMLIVFSDVTQLRRLEDMRRIRGPEPEIKTPLTAIKGFVKRFAERRRNPEEAERFLGIVSGTWTG